MTVIVNGIVINEGSCLLVKRGLLYVLPGGKPYTAESDQQCLERVFRNGLSDTCIENPIFYRRFVGLSDTQRQPLDFVGYLVKVRGAIGLPSGETRERVWANKDNCAKDEDIGETTRAIAEQLSRDGLLK